MKFRIIGIFFFIVFFITAFNLFVFLNYPHPTSNSIEINHFEINERPNANENNNEDERNKIILEKLQKNVELNFKNELKNSLDPLILKINEISNSFLNQANQMTEKPQINQQIDQINQINEINQIEKEEEEKCTEIVKEKIIYKKHQKKFDWEEEMAKLDWNIVERSINSNLPSKWIEEYLHITIPFLEEVKGPLTNTIAPPLDLDCRKEKYSKFLSGKRRRKSVRVFDLTEMAYELDTLEIRLFELEDVVDEFVLLEGMFTHTGIKKPLFLERNMDRYERWRNKIKHFVWDERMAINSDRLNSKFLANTEPIVDWSLEKKSREYLMQAFLDIHHDGKDLNEDDLIILGDLDEIPQREVIAHLKHCEVKDGFFPTNLLAHFWRFSFHWKMDEICECPSIVTWKNLRDDKVPLRGDESFDSRIVNSAWHLNRFGPAIMQVIKEFSVAEGELTVPADKPETLRNITYVKELMDKGVRPCCPWDLGKLRFVENPIESGVSVPWIVLANRDSDRWQFL